MDKLAMLLVKSCCILYAGNILNNMITTISICYQILKEIQYHVLNIMNDEMKKRNLYQH